MNALKLNFSQQASQRKRNRLRVLLLLLLLVAAFFVNEYLTIKKQYLTLAQQSLQPAAKQPVVLSHEQQQQHLILSHLADELNVPWIQFFAAIESVKSRHPDIFLLALEPNPKKSQLIISGQAQALDQLLAFIDEMNQQPEFAEVLLMDQFIDAEQDDVMRFTLRARWLRDE